MNLAEMRAEIERNIENIEAEIAATTARLEDLNRTLSDRNGALRTFVAMYGDVESRQEPSVLVPDGDVPVITAALDRESLREHRWREGTLFAWIADTCEHILHLKPGPLTPEVLYGEIKSLGDYAVARMETSKSPVKAISGALSGDIRFTCRPNKRKGWQLKSKLSPEQLFKT